MIKAKMGGRFLRSLIGRHGPHEEPPKKEIASSVSKYTVRIDGWRNITQASRNKLEIVLHV